ncbi:hypothetical protein E2C01_078008 [Portunus trituberculatus]|uniref:Uncharacterized protein n=1 Tax=Portunus trituberculatus TaxID=210409 RepID=A0A5B7ICV6_PORTR|nr:hypothetical protein [Portunus trituberculatus]
MTLTGWVVWRRCGGGAVVQWWWFTRFNQLLILSLEAVAQRRGTVGRVPETLLVAVTVPMLLIPQFAHSHTLVPGEGKEEEEEG